MPEPPNALPKQRTTFLQDFRRFFLRGLAVFLPPVLTIWILYELWVFLDQNVGTHANYAVRYVTAQFVAQSRSDAPENSDTWVQLANRGRYVPAHVFELVRSQTPAGQRLPIKVSDFYERYLLYAYWEPYHLSFIGLIVAAVFIYFIGHFLATFIGNAVWRATEQTVFRLPIVRAVYPHVKQFIDFLLSEQKPSYSRVVAVEYPRRGIWSMGLVTGEGVRDLERATGQELLTIFVPYSPWSMTGYAITVPRSELLDLNITVDEAIRFVVSGGVIKPRTSGPPLLVAPGGAIVPSGSSAAAGFGETGRAARRLRVGTRGSQLARAQAQWIVERLRELAAGREVELVEIKTSGDHATEAKLREIAGEGLFTKEIQRALLDGEVDIGVHSLKDLPTQPVSGLVLAAVPRRAPALDVLVAPRFGDWRSLPSGARIGTSSPRRRGQLLRLRGDLVIEEIRGNVPTRLQKIDDLGLAGVVLAHAGLQRLGLEQRITYRFTPSEMLPAPGQGALAIECRAEDQELAELVARLDDAATRQATTAERAVLARLAGGCHVPLGAYATVADGWLGLRAAVCAPDGSRLIADSIAGSADEAECLAEQLADRLIAAGARELV